MATLAVFLVAGCDDGAEDPVHAQDARPRGGDSTAAPAPNADGAPAPRTIFPLGSSTPFAPYGAAVDAVFSGPAPDEAADRARFEASQADVAACMKDAGFEYQPYPYDPDERLSLPWTDGSVMLPVLPAQRADAERWGYGTHDVDAQEDARADDERDDANAGYVGGLSEQAQAAYQLALTGVHGVDDPDPEPGGGCAGRAQAAHPEPEVDVTLGDEYLPLVRAMGRLLEDDLPQDPQVVALDDEWTGCMLDAGIDVAPPADLVAGRRLARHLAPNGAFTLAVLTGADGTARWPAPDETSDDVPVENRYLVGDDAEHRIAVADFDCRASTHYVDRLKEAVTRLEGDFVASHRAQLDAMVAAAAGH